MREEIFKQVSADKVASIFYQNNKYYVEYGRNNYGMTYDTIAEAAEACREYFKNNRKRDSYKN